jgi:spermidine synthase
MSRLFEELDYRPTPIGALVLRRRHEARLGVDVLEIKLGEEHLMSDLFTASEIALANLGLAACEGEGLDVVVGGLGLGYTAKAALDEPRTGSLVVVEYLEAVIDWHLTGLLPLGDSLTGDPRCRLVEGDFFAMARSEVGFDFAMARSEVGFDPETPGRLFDAILLDIDHSPDALLDARSESFYQPEGLEKLAAHLKPGGIFGLWSDEQTDDAFTGRLSGVFSEAWAEPVTFHNPLQDRPFTQTVYLARKG